MRKSPFAVELQGPPLVREWYLMDPSKDGSPCVIKRRFKYWQTNLSRLAAAEERLTEYRKRDKCRQHQVDVIALSARIENRKAWCEFSAQTLRNSVRFARARITPDGNDYALLMRLCPKCHIDTATLPDESPFVSAKLDNGKSEVRCAACAEVEPYQKLKRGVTRHPRGRQNKKFHEDLRYYDRVLDQFFLAKKSVSGSSLSEGAMDELLKLTRKAIGHFKNQSAREADDAEQQAVLGLMEAARKFDPDPAVSKRAKFTTYASLWIRRRAQARKTSHCKPGVAIVNKAGKATHVSTAHIEMGDGEEGSSDRYHPGAKSTNMALQLDVANALAGLDEQARDIVTSSLIDKESLESISTRLGLSISKIRSVIAASKDTLAKALADHAG